MFEQLQTSIFFEGFRQRMVATSVWATECKHVALGAPHIRRMCSNVHLNMSFTPLAQAPIIAITKAATKFFEL